MINAFISTLKNNRSWLILAVIFFIGGTFLTYAALHQDPQALAMLEEAIFPVLEELGEEVFTGHPLYGALILFFHNLTASLQVILLGLILGIPPLFSAIANGSVLGILAFQLGQEGVAVVPFLLAGILPHGIFELPAFLLSAAFGLKLGYHLVFPLPGLKRLESVKNIFREIGGALPMIVILLAIAALIEVFITPAVLLYFFN
ncbi:stage II sporulation protein M [Dethiobacter alkaliphilus]|uniref:Stage II sporulation protein M n=1 Tax=Dethiobacter alkaliphilus AHT 1 TaxID=555088 RepID=C0GIP8_DETAL|nr:stage II sporulation protein M [Dethiobacter alkaliphilus]EEG76712.1 protein of unknown function DUF95 transmembrane [Dethiobacter alkaliphilus AHT 1]